MTGTRSLAFVWGSRAVINWRYVIRGQMMCYRNNRYLHDVPECLLVKNCPTLSGLPTPVANKIQNAIQYKDRSPDWWCLAHTMTSARAVMYCVILVRPKQDGSFLWSHDLSRDLQKVDTKWTQFPTSLDGLAIALRLPSPFATFYV